MKRCVCAAFMAMVPAGAALAGANPNLVANGSFELPSFSDVNNDDGLGIYFYTRPGNNLFQNWANQVGSLGVVLRTRPGFWEAQDGNQYVEVESGFASYWEQSIVTVPGQRYTVSFWYAANPAVAPANPDDAVLLLWNGTQLVMADGASSDPQHLAWTLQQVEVTATSALTVLRFEDGFVGQPFNGGFIDNVSVVAVPSAGGVGVLAALGVVGVRRRRR